ncbi:GNAT family N-acetyltransferase [Ramlibacter algicola]|uniref:GNAT family N-acetyltransferase n=1 Tax=Ramlibacter algicola TaxID=2795217 RepID=A0A934Q1Q3_9BURK|nr:GNAT family N-acetyltransferase [Ramlibacter algicola]MBK0392886.1 GNAT family N-acetyltransferase [Ramlibacter algicola]
MTDDDIERLERATLAAVPPRELLALEGWLVGLDPGTVGRAHSAVPTRHERLRVDLVPEILDAYAQRGLRPAFRVPDVAGCQLLCDDLAGRGFAATQPTLVQTGPAASLSEVDGGAAVEFAARPDAAWSALFLGDGFDPVDGASRIGILQRSDTTLFASVRFDGVVAAVGSACFSDGWAGVHGMRTAPGCRGRGLAGSILAAFGREAARRSLERVMLQVEERNAPARSLYGRAGLRTAWRYAYWRPA